jgi:hypothetical protein
MCLGPVTAAELRGDSPAAEGYWLQIPVGFDQEVRRWR